MKLRPAPTRSIWLGERCLATTSAIGFRLNGNSATRTLTADRVTAVKIPCARGGRRQGDSVRGYFREFRLPHIERGRKSATSRHSSFGLLPHCRCLALVMAPQAKRQDEEQDPEEDGIPSNHP